MKTKLLVSLLSCIPYNTISTTQYKFGIGFRKSRAVTAGPVNSDKNGLQLSPNNAATTYFHFQVL